MNRVLKNTLFALQCLLLTACKNDFEPSFTKAQNAYDLAVEGGINTYQKVQYIRLTKPSMDPDSVPQPLSNAIVKVNDGEKDIAFKETAAGIYSGTVNNNANYNKPYKLIINYNGNEYTATDTLRQVINIIDDYLPLSAVRNSAGNIKGTIPRHTFGYLYSSRWLIAYSDIPLWNPSKFDEMLYYSYTHSLGSPNSLYPLTDQNREFELNPADNLTIYKFSLSESYARYLYSLFQETEWKGIFSGVPGKIKGNISGNAVGYFYVTDVDLRKYKASELVQ